MEKNVAELFTTLWSIISATEFWSAITGAFVGGLIAYLVQVTALREGRRLRDEDHKMMQEALGRALLIKMMRAYSNFHGIHQHIEDSFAEAARRGFEAEPSFIVQPLANTPDPVHFSSEEMGMLLGLKDYDVFNLVLSMDVIHNSLIDAVKVLNTERETLTEQIGVHGFEGAILDGNLVFRQ